MGRYKINFNRLIRETFGKKNHSYCPDYIGKACVDGTCPKLAKIKTLHDTPIEDCSKCPFYKGCYNCELWDSKYCKKNNI